MWKFVGEAVKLYFHAGRSKSCKRDSRYLLLCKLLLQKKKPEIQIQMSELDKISVALWEIVNVGIMLLRERNSVLRRTIFRNLWITFMSRDKRKRASMDNRRLEYWWRQVTVWTLDRCDNELLNKNPPKGHMWVSKQTDKEVTARPGHIWPEEWSRMSRNSQRKAINGCKKNPNWTLRESSARHLLSSERCSWLWGNHGYCHKKIGKKKSLSRTLRSHQTSQPERFKLEAPICKWLVKHLNEKIEFFMLKPRSRGHHQWIAKSSNYSE